MIGDKYYRYDGYEFLSLDVYRAIEETKLGVWVAPEWDKKGEYKKLVRNWVYKRFAYRTSAEALDSFKRRKQSEIKLLERRLERAKLALNEAYKLDSETPKVYPPICYGYDEEVYY